MNWESLVQINDSWVEKYLVEHGFHNDFKLKIRCYSIKFSGTKLNFEALARHLAYHTPEFTFSPHLIKKMGERKALMEAVKFFGKKDTNTDGKYGELFLFALVESVLKCPMVAYKLPNLTNFRDQVKGGDGIFLGNYEYKPGLSHSACLIGESKIMQGFSSCVDDAVKSLDRFHNVITAPEFNATEFIAAKNHIFNDDNVDVDLIYNSLTPGTDEFMNNILVHPIFLMYETTEIEKIEKKACIPEEAERLMREYLEKRGKDHLDLIAAKLKSAFELQKIYLDFFIIPVNNVSKFRNELYYHIHGQRLDEDE